MKIVVGSVTMVYLLSSVRDSTLGHDAPGAFSDPRVLPVVARFNARLREVERESTARDATRYLSYPYLHPSQILQSISIGRPAGGRGRSRPSSRAPGQPGRVHSVVSTTGSCIARSRSRSRLPTCSESGACTHL